MPRCTSPLAANPTRATTRNAVDEWAAAVASVEGTMPQYDRRWGNAAERIGPARGIPIG